jgi:hypothetical protein
MTLFGRYSGSDANCTIDGAALDAKAQGESFYFTWRGKESNVDGMPHTLKLDVEIFPFAGSSGSLSIDSLRYLPAADSELLDAEALVEYDDNDPHIAYGPVNWEAFVADDGGSASATNQPGSSATILFIGKHALTLIERSDDQPLSLRNTNHMGRVDCGLGDVKRDVLDRQWRACALCLCWNHRINNPRDQAHHIRRTLERTT